LKEFENAWGIETRFSPPPGNTPALTDMVKDQLLRIVQEALSNIHRHAQAKRVEILITSVEDALTLIVSDDGCGFDPLNIVADGTNHFGLTIMRERAELIGGKVEIRSAAGQGAQILIYVPYALSNSRAEETAELHGLRVLLVDDHPLLLEGMRSLLTSRGIHVIGTANDGLQARELARILHPDLIVMDIEMPNCNGIEATQAIKTDFPEMKIVIMTVSDDDEHLIEAIKNGAAGYMLKGMDTKAIFPLLAEVMRGETAIAQNLAARVLKDIVHDRKISQPAGLTARQWDVLRMVAGGLTYKEVGSKLSLSERAVKYHMGQILERLQVNSRDEAILYARKFTEKDK
jgi:two-component system NarL family response regulator